jgi:Phosphodiester glycosidase
VHAYAAWINTSTTDIALYPGYKGPGPSTLPRGPQMVPLTGRPRLLAAFNSGFYESDAPAGFFTHHTLYFPMVKGAATLIQYKDGSVDIKAWDGGKRPGTDVLMARQNLSLLINDSLPTNSTSNNALWGATLHGVSAVWRTAIGIDAQGSLIYAAAPAQTSHSLALLMSKLHVVRAMQLDINPAWPIFVTYANRGAKGPSLFVPNPNQVSTRFLYSSTKDFFAVFAPKSAGEPQPW